MIKACFLACSDFEDIFDVRHFIDSLRDEIKIIKRLPKKFTRKYGYQPLEMPPVSWSSEKYYMEQVCMPHLVSVFINSLKLILNIWFHNNRLLINLSPCSFLHNFNFHHSLYVILDINSLVVY